MDISMDIHRKSVDMDMDMDGKFHIHGKPALFAQKQGRVKQRQTESKTNYKPKLYKHKKHTKHKL